MTEISAAAVKALRDRTQLPMMKCKWALQQTGGDPEAAIELLRKEGSKIIDAGRDRETSSGRVEVYASIPERVGAIIELQCESDPVAKNEGFRQLCADLARQLATGPGASTPDELLDQPSPSQPGMSLRDQMNDLLNRIREVFRLARVLRIDGPCAGYMHHTGTLGVLVQVEGGDADTAREIAMHTAAMKPQVVRIEDLPPEVVAKEREILAAAARKEGKPENIIAKMVEGRLRNFYAEQVLLEQPFVKDDSQTVGKLAKARGMNIVRFVRWELGKR